MSPSCIVGTERSTTNWIAAILSRSQATCSRAASSWRRWTPDAYRDAQVAWEDTRRADWLQLADSILSDDAYPDNRARFDRVADATSAGSVIPFVGSGLGVPCGNPTWSDFLRSLAVNTQAGASETVEQFLSNGQFEEAAQFIAEALGPSLFWERLENRLTQDVRLRGPVLLLAETFGVGCVVTTNFDSILEDAFELAGGPLPARLDRPHTRPFLTRASTSAATSPSSSSSTEDAEADEGRVLTLDEFNDLYGEGVIDFGKPVPSFALKLLSQPLLFIGCGLNDDRVLKLASAAAQVAAALPTRHYAIIEAPPDGGTPLAQREHALAQAEIYPIWYPNAEHEAVEALLVALADRTRQAPSL